MLCRRKASVGYMVIEMKQLSIVVLCPIDIDTKVYLLTKLLVKLYVESHPIYYKIHIICKCINE